MQKKVFLQRNPRRASAGGGPYLKYLVVAVVCLVLLVLITPYLLKGKSKDIAKRPVPEKGAITKEVPRSIDQQMPTKLPETTAPAESAPVPAPNDGKPAEVATAPEAAAPPQVQPAPVQESNVATPQQAATEAFSTPDKVPPAPEPAPKDLFPKKSAPSEVQATAQPNAAAKEAKPAKPGVKIASLAPAAKTPAAKPLTGKGGYAVQVGSFFKTKTEAETLCKDLSKKGYNAVVRPVKNSSRFYVTTGATIESKAYTLQEQLKIQGLQTTKIIRLDTAVRPAQKSVPKKPDTSPEGAQPQG